MKIVAENLQGLNPVVARALEREDAETLQRLALEYRDAGADALDVNPGYSRKGAEGRMAFMVEAVQEAVSLPLFLDAPEANVVEAGLKACKTTAVINFLSAEASRLETFLPLLEKYNVSAVAAVMDKQVPLTAEDKLTVASLLVKEASLRGIGVDRLIFDPILVPLPWGDGQRYARETLRFLDLLPQVMEGEIKTLAALSNLTSRAAGTLDRQEWQSVYLSMLAARGLTYAMINMNHRKVRATARMIDAFTGDRPFSAAEFSERERDEM